MSSAYLPISDRWHHYIRQSDDLSQELEKETTRVLANQAKQTCQLLSRAKDYKVKYLLFIFCYVVLLITCTGRSLAVESRLVSTRTPVQKERLWRKICDKPRSIIPVCLVQIKFIQVATDRAEVDVFRTAINRDSSVQGSASMSRISEMVRGTLRAS